MKQTEQVVEVMQTAFVAADGTIFTLKDNCVFYEQVIVRATPQDWVTEFGLTLDDVTIVEVAKISEALVYSKKFPNILLFTLKKVDEGYIPSEHLSMSPEIDGDFACFRNWRISLNALRMSFDHLSFSNGTAEDTVKALSHFKKMLPYYIKWVGVQATYVEKIEPLIKDFCDKATATMDLSGVTDMCKEYQTLIHEDRNEQAGL